MFTQTLYAQGGAQAGSPFMSIGMMVAIFAIFYFLLIRPQRQQQKKLANRISALKKGDKVIISGGIVAEYVSEKEGGRLAVVKVGEDTKIEVIKSAISAVVTDEMLNPPVKVKEEKKIKEDKNSIKEELKKASKKEDK